MSLLATSNTPPRTKQMSEPVPGHEGMLWKTIITPGKSQMMPHTNTMFRPTAGATVTVHYTGTLEDGTVFDSSVAKNRPFQFILGEGNVIKGWDAGIPTMDKGEKCILKCHPDYAYGQSGFGPGIIPPNATLTFEVELIKWQDLR
jgi:FK506-binding protein 1